MGVSSRFFEDLVDEGIDVGIQPLEPIGSVGWVISILDGLSESSPLYHWTQDGYWTPSPSPSFHWSELPAQLAVIKEKLSDLDVGVLFVG